MRIPAVHLYARRCGKGRLRVELLPDVPTWRARGDARDCGACRAVERIAGAGKPERVITASDGELRSRPELDAGSKMVDVFLSIPEEHWIMLRESLGSPFRLAHLKNL